MTQGDSRGLAEPFESGAVCAADWAARVDTCG